MLKIVHGGKGVTVLSVGRLWCPAGREVPSCTVLVCERRAVVPKVQVRNGFIRAIEATERAQEVTPIQGGGLSHGLQQLVICTRSLWITLDHC